MRSRIGAVQSLKGESKVCEAKLGPVYNAGDRPTGTGTSGTGSGTGSANYEYGTGSVEYRAVEFTHVFVTVTDTSIITTTIFDLLGNLVLTIVDDGALYHDFLKNGTYTMDEVWDGRNEKGRYTSHGGYVFLVSVYFPNTGTTENLKPLKYAYR